MRPRLVPVVFILVCAAALCAGVVGAVADSGGPLLLPSPAESPSPGVSSSAAPAASPELLVWAGKWAKVAGRDRRRIGFLRWCLGLPGERSLPRRPAAGGGQGAWATYGRVCRHLARRWVALEKQDQRCIFCLRLVSAVCWRPLIRYCRWPGDEVANVVRCIRAESGGQPRASNGVCIGLMQIHHCWLRTFGWFERTDPYQNILHGLRIWASASVTVAQMPTFAWVLRRQIRSDGGPVIGVNRTHKWGLPLYGALSDHTMVLYGVQQYGGERYVSIMNPSGGFYYPPVPYEQACRSAGTSIPSYGISAGWDWVNTITCLRC